MDDCMINLKKVEDSSKKIYEGSFELSLLQQELENMLNAIDKNNMEFEKGKISRNAFKSNETKLKKNSIDIIKNIKILVKNNLDFLASIRKDVEKQVTTKPKKAKKKGKKNDDSKKDKTESD
jgi:hypothetical protein